MLEVQQHKEPVTDQGVEAQLHLLWTVLKGTSGCGGTAPPSLDIVKGDLGVWTAQLHLLWTLLKWTSGCGRHLLWALLKGTSGIQHHRLYCWGTTQQKGQSECQCAIVLCAFSLFMLHIYSELSAPAQKLSGWPAVAGFSVCWFGWVCLFSTLSTVFH